MEGTLIRSRTTILYIYIGSILKRALSIVEVYLKTKGFKEGMKIRVD